MHPDDREHDHHDSDAAPATGDDAGSATTTAIDSLADDLDRASAEAGGAPDPAAGVLQEPDSARIERLRARLRDRFH